MRLSRCSDPSSHRDICDDEGPVRIQDHWPIAQFDRPMRLVMRLNESTFNHMIGRFYTKISMILGRITGPTYWPKSHYIAHNTTTRCRLHAAYNAHLLTQLTASSLPSSYTFAELPTPITPPNSPRLTLVRRLYLHQTPIPLQNS